MHRQVGGQFWSITNVGNIWMALKDSRVSNKYNKIQFMKTVAHEFGHVLGLADAYPAPVNDNCKIFSNGEIVYGDFAKSGNMMNSNGYVNSNEIEMALESHCTNSMQYFFDSNTSDSIKKSRVVRAKQIVDPS